MKNIKKENDLCKHKKEKGLCELTLDGEGYLFYPENWKVCDFKDKDYHRCPRYCNYQKNTIPIIHMSMTLYPIRTNKNS